MSTIRGTTVIFDLDGTLVDSEPNYYEASQPDVILMMSKGLESVGGVDGLVEIPGIRETPAGMDRRVVDLEDGVLLSFGPRTPLVIDVLVERLHRG